MVNANIISSLSQAFTSAEPTTRCCGLCVEAFAGDLTRNQTPELGEFSKNDTKETLSRLCSCGFLSFFFCFAKCATEKEESRSASGTSTFAVATKLVSTFTASFMSLQRVRRQEQKPSTSARLSEWEELPLPPTQSGLCKWEERVRPPSSGAPFCCGGSDYITQVRRQVLMHSVSQAVMLSQLM